MFGGSLYFPAPRALSPALISPAIPTLPLHLLTGLVISNSYLPLDFWRFFCDPPQLSLIITIDSDFLPFASVKSVFAPSFWPLKAICFSCLYRNRLQCSDLTFLILQLLTSVHSFNFHFSWFICW